MRKITLIYLLLTFFVFQNYAIAQTKPDIKFGKITVSDFNISFPIVDSNANAVVIADIGKSSFEGNNKGWFSLLFTKHKRIKIINKNGFNTANVVIQLYKSPVRSKEELDQLKAVTYNLENGNVTATKLDTKNVFNDPVVKNFILKKFTLPAVKEGSIIEFSYTIKSNFLCNLQPWDRAKIVLIKKNG